MEVPCGQCIGCRLERSRQWAIRLTHEASLWPQNCFITLTYSPEHIPKDKSLNKKHFQDFMKRLRKKYCKDGKKIRFFHCGEYGEKYGRPHYHAILFNHHFEDAELFKKTKSGSIIYRSDDLENLWPFGYSSIGDVTFESTAYVARYVLKKVTGELAEEHYKREDENGNEWFVTPEYCTMSRGGRTGNNENLGGIGKRWIDNYMADVFPEDKMVVVRTKNGKKKYIPSKPPRYYLNQYELTDELMAEQVKQNRLMKSLEKSDDNTDIRMKAKEACTRDRLKKLIRPLNKRGSL